MPEITSSTGPYEQPISRPPDGVTDVVARAAAGDQSAWDELMTRYGRLVMAVARRHRLNQAECDDVAQATWLRLVQRITTLRKPESVGDWLATVARNESLRVISRERRATPMAEPVSAGWHTPEVEGPEGSLLLRSDMDAVRRALATLAERDRTLLQLVLADPAPTYARISELTGIPVASIGPTRTRCLRKLRLILSEWGVGPDADTTRPEAAIS